MWVCSKSRATPSATRGKSGRHINKVTSLTLQAYQQSRQSDLATVRSEVAYTLTPQLTRHARDADRAGLWWLRTKGPSIQATEQPVLAKAHSTITAGSQISNPTQPARRESRQTGRGRGGYVPKAICMTPVRPTRAISYWPQQWDCWLQVGNTASQHTPRRQS